ncbi:CDP-diacylglycerol--glycerol-3-phosphate 3-phosphatidyltransferase [Streptococcus sp. zg-86]|uniref:CDP-diacylglycerol--glycerol-3-phosphate 3-phosphatidyltransferase n=1 Tax=Streptococcus zhangguiae TaxID=2664091 RepID=A0A6I4RN77_9STRE|nr:MULTISPECIES: CDP-diacylglycerol--glycerol-3-phosphate 3-phosphatidyltransferase [unclassified Streptococcus]MTB63427.1 CDP-diacylglycerol--glycerol-3-phosphate 3-phosphatidyltransferase [Streptococcus sp. zg-86]MTB89924.1 CDP-diacylglycerol--glycerol-3-phosphate 3-phosphatidyltransferase [Streptococcus sp. zg-36]MWV55595.1 CDP-diacylglycerol--glycerol-3-phosphate 3-phosphatidyltransferase [Streptococcus sp. zg-70]QTH47783.1 CDP-diacylglycerol--glycerol-3-phosphate 3-phosphatidyltransferase 
MKKEHIPNTLTLGRILVIPLFILILSVWNSLAAHIVAAILFALASLTDYLDGYLARKWQVVTNFGKFADPMADKILVMTAFIMLVELGFAPAWIVAVIICRELAVTGLRLLLVENGGTVLAAAMPGKIKTFSQMFAIIFLLVHWQLLGTITLYIALFFTLYSGYDYFKGASYLFKDTFQ